MRLGASYNVYDGEELLESSISCIRENVDFICIVYQNTSNFGETRNDLEPVLADLKSRGLVDYIYLYEPKDKMGKRKGEFNEICKRNIGKEICVKLGGCTHHITLDCDEMFVPSEFANAKQEVIKGNFDTTYVPFDNYYKKPNLKIKVDENNGYFAYISFIVKCDDRNYGTGATPVIVDGTRGVICRKYHIFNREDIIMHHYSWMRSSEESLRRKLNNTSFKQHEGMEAGIETIVKNYLKYKDGDKATMFWVNGAQEQEVEIVEDKIKIYNLEKIIL